MTANIKSKHAARTLLYYYKECFTRCNYNNYYYYHYHHHKWSPIM